MNNQPSDLAIHEETFRIDAVKRYMALSLDKEGQLQEIVELASQLCTTSIALITLVDETKQYFVAKVGLDMEGTGREESFCTHTIKQDDIMMIPDSMLDSTFIDNPLVTGAPHIRFYAGIPLETFDGHKIGSLCVIDREPKTLSKFQQDTLRVLSRQVISNMELRQTLTLLNVQKQIIEDSEADYKTKLEALNEQLKSIIQLQSHQIRGPVTSLKGLMHLIKTEHPEINQEYIHLLEVVVDQLDDEIHQIVKSAYDSLIDI